MLFIKPRNYFNYRTKASVLRYPGPRGFLLILSFFYLRREDRSAEPRKRKPLVETVGNLTFMLAQYLTAVKDVIFFWPITKEDRIDNLLTGKGGSVLRCSQINLLRRDGRGEEPAFAMFTTSCQIKSLQTSWVLFAFLKGTDYFFGT